MPHAVVSNQQRGRAKQLRKAMTRAETLLWRYLKANRVDGLGFRRQAPIRNYIVDFACFSANLIIELDGETHYVGNGQEEDRRRQMFIESLGIGVLPFLNSDLYENLEGVWEAIARAVRERMEQVGPEVPRGRRSRRDGNA